MKHDATTQMKFLFLAPLPSAFGEALHGARLASGLVECGHSVTFAAPSASAPTCAGRPFELVPIDAALTRLDTEVETLVTRLGADVLVLVDAAAIDKVTRAFRRSSQRIAAAAPQVVSIDCWNLQATRRAWDYGPVAEPIDRWLLEHTPVIRPVPNAPFDAPGGYAALPTRTLPSKARRDETRRRWGLPERGGVIVWPTARWQLPESHDQPALASIARVLQERLAPIVAALDATIVHVSWAPIADRHRSPNYRHVDVLAAADFEELVGAADVLLSFNAAATSLATAVSLGVPTVLCTARDPHGHAPPLWAWPLSLDEILAPTVRGNPFYETMAMVDLERDGELVRGLEALLFDVAIREQHQAAQERYRAMVRELPDGVARLLAMVREVP